MGTNKTKGYIVLAAAVVMQTCLGGVYAWSVFCEPLQRAFGYAHWQTQLVFGTCIFTFTFLLIFTGRLQDRLGPRPLAIASGVLLAIGYGTSSLGGSQFALLWLGSGVLCGLAISAGYVTPIATAVKWFPNRRGLVSGLAVAGYGLSAIILMAVARRLLSAGWPVLRIFGLAGVIYGAVVVAMAMLLFLPGPIEHHHLRAFRRRTLLRDGRFAWLCIAMFTASFPALIFIGNVTKITNSFGSGRRVADLALVAVAVGNCAGRVLWGFVYDWLGGRRAALTSMACIVLSAVLIVLARGLGPAYVAAAAWMGFCYGGCFAIYAPETSKLYGPAVMGSVYPLVLLAHGITAITGPSMAGWVFDRWGSYLPGLIGGGAVTLAGLAVCTLWKHPIEVGEAEAAGRPVTPEDIEAEEDEVVGGEL